MLAVLSSRRTITTLASIALVLVGGAAWAVANDAEAPEVGAAETASEPPPPPANTAEAALFMRLGLSAEALCAAGVDAEDVQTLCDAAFDEMDANPTTLRDLDEAYGAAKVSRDVLKRKVQSGLASANEVQALAAAETTLANAEQVREEYIDDIRAAAFTTISAPEVAVLEQVRDNRDWQLPVEFLVESRTEPDWVDLRDALSTERIASKYGGAFPQSVQSSLATYRGRSAVATARTNLSTYLASVQTAWNAAVTPE